jgi:phosphoribosyl 1,2-cyclic phosphodiesterase
VAHLDRSNDDEPSAENADGAATDAAAPDGAATRVWVLGSGSRGNAVAVEHGGAYLLLDAGFELPELVGRLRAVDIAPADVEHVVLSHGHRDHVIGAAAGARAYGWRIWATLGTLWHWRALRHVPVQPFEPGEALELAPFRVLTAPTPHDIGESAAVVVEVPATGARIGYCTDLGHAPAAVQAMLRELDVLILEANYDVEMLENGPYRPELRARVAGDQGHLGNLQAAALLSAVAGRRLRTVVLAHISAHNNTPPLALATVAEHAGLDAAVECVAAPQDRPIGPFVVRPADARRYSAAGGDATFRP